MGLPVILRRYKYHAESHFLDSRASYCYSHLPPVQEPTAMTVIDKLATSLSRRDEAPNQELAARLVQTADKEAIRELVENLN